jgi:hypothetical protein
MLWNKPRKIWQWLLLFTPAVVAIVAAQVAKWWMPPIPPLHLGNGALVANVGQLITRVSGIALAVIAACSVLIAIILSRAPGWGDRIANGVFWMLCLFFVNSFVALGGCMVLGVPEPEKYEIAPPPIDSRAEKSSAQP